MKEPEDFFEHLQLTPSAKNVFVTIPILPGLEVDRVLGIRDVLLKREDVCA
jgi:hypothetical protein